MSKTVITAVTTTTSPPLKRENCELTKHDSDFSDWKVLIGPCDWEEYLLNKEGAERYRTQNLPNCSHNLPNCSSRPGVYELGIIDSRTKGKSSSNVIPVYLGQADNVRTRMQQYGRDGDHLENGEQNDRKELGLFSDIFRRGFAIAFRWAPKESKKDAEKTESRLLKTYDYAWNREMNGNRRPNDIHLKLNNSASRTIKRCDPPILEIGSTFYTKQKDQNIPAGIFKFGRSRPVLVSKEYDMYNNDNEKCGVSLGRGSICIKPPVEGRKRCEDHKGMKVNSQTNTEETRNLSCGVTLDDGSLCTKAPVLGRQRCEEHKGMRTNGRVPIPLIVQEKLYLPSSSSYSLNSGADSLTCGAVTRNGSFCKRKPGKYSKLCWQHGAM